VHRESGNVREMVPLCIVANVISPPARGKNLKNQSLECILMPQTGMKGPFALNREAIDTATTASPGVYALGYVEVGGDFIPKHVGRSDDDVNRSLKDWVNTKYSKFKFECYDSPEAAFARECELYHDWKEQLDNQEHPRRRDTRWACPCCELSEDANQE
jgi:hypothetical protein